MTASQLPGGFAALTREYAMLPPGGRILCAVSGGADSVCLLHLLRRQAEEVGFSLFAAHYDHQLRGEESTRDASFVENLCREWQIPLTLGRGDVAEEARRRRAGLEETAREMRYAFLEETARTLDCSLIATAHNADDNVETALLHLIRGAGLQGLSGMAPRRGFLIRPLLSTGRAEIVEYLRQENLPYVEDSSNQDITFTRNHIRHEVLPLLHQINPQFSQRMGQTLRSLRADHDFLTAQAAQVAQNARWAEDDLVIEARHIAQAPDAIAPRAVRWLLGMLGDGSDDCTAAHLSAVVELARGEDPSAVVFLPGGKMAQRVYRELLFTTRQPPQALTPAPLTLEGETCPAGALWACRCRRTVCPAQSPPGVYYVAAFQGTPVLRPRQTGDEIRLPGRDTKTIKKLLIDHKFPRRDRDRLPVLADEGGVVALAGFGPEVTRLAQPGEAAYEISFYLPSTPHKTV